MNDIAIGDRVRWAGTSASKDKPEFLIEGVVKRLRQRNGILEAYVRPLTVSGFDMFVRVDKLTRIDTAGGIDD